MLPGKAVPLTYFCQPGPKECLLCISEVLSHKWEIYISPPTRLRVGHRRGDIRIVRARGLGFLEQNSVF